MYAHLRAKEKRAEEEAKYWTNQLELFGHGNLGEVTGKTIEEVRTLIGYYNGKAEAYNDIYHRFTPDT